MSVPHVSLFCSSNLINVFVVNTFRLFCLWSPSCLAIGYLYVGTEPHDLIDVGVNWPPSNSTCGVYAYI